MFVQKGSRVKSRMLMTAAAAAVLSIAGLASAATPPAATPLDKQFFDWQVNNTQGYLSSPFLTDQSAHAVDEFIQKLPKKTPIAVKVQSPLSTATTNLIFNNPNYHVSYVLGDVANPNSNLAQLVRQVRYVNGVNNGTKTQSFNAFIGNTEYQKLASSIGSPAGWPSTLSGYNSAKLNMSMPTLYPGQESFKNPAAGNSTAPNIRSALFTLPIIRVGEIKVNNTSNERIIPYVARFNNWGNLALDSDRNASNGYLFVPGQAMPAKFGLPAVSAAETTDQMLSRRDFAAQVMHYRLRGADSFVAFEPGVIDYINEQKRKDARTGWTEPHIDKIFKKADAKLLLGTDTDYPPADTGASDVNGNITIDGVNKSDESAGAIFSGVYSLDLKTMDVLMSNMDDEDHRLTLPSKVGGFTLRTTSFDVDAGAHLLVEYKLSTSGQNKGWSVALQHVPFQAISNSRNGFGIPEPGTISIAAMAGFFAIGRRRRGERKPDAQREAKVQPFGLIGGNMLSANVMVI